MKCNLWPNGNILPIKWPVKTATIATRHRTMPLKAREQSFRVEQENPITEPLPLFCRTTMGLSSSQSLLAFFLYCWLPSLGDQHHQPPTYLSNT